MGKKKAVRPVESAPSKARLELRFDNEVYEKIKLLADDAQISVNQLMQSLALWAGTYGHAGEPRRDAEGFLRNVNQPGCVWVGTLGWKPDELDDHELAWNGEELSQIPEKDRKGTLNLNLDFTERRVLRDDVE